ncbi:MAG: hypothetical protein DI527_18120 [Chelatococcus sp.]|nr:MAG: hypothetical protein DI527_18120 [Chelatococcus sp.]
MIDLQDPLVQRIVAAIGPIETSRSDFGRQMSAVSAAVGIHLGQVVRAIGAPNPDEAMKEAASIMAGQALNVARAQFAFDSMDAGQRQ